MSTEFLYLNEQEMIEAGVLDFGRCVDVLEEMFELLGKGDYVMGGNSHNSHGIAIAFPDEPAFENMPKNGPDRRFMAMPAYLGGRFNVCGMKWYGSNIVNPQRGLPRSILTVALNDVETCEPLAYMSANLISAVRTGSVPGVVVRHLANPSSEVCTCIGAGPISKACFQGIYAVAKNLKTLVVYDLVKEKSEAFCEWAAKEFGLNCIAADTLEEAVRMGDIVSSATSSLKPVDIKDEWLKKGSTIIFTGRCHIEDSYFDNCKVAFDNSLMHQEYYDFDMAKPETDRWKSGIGMQVYRLMFEGKLPPVSQTPSLGDVVCGKCTVRESEDDRICFVTSGMPVEDVAWGYDLYQTALEKGIGTKLALWPEKPYWT